MNCDLEKSRSQHRLNFQTSVTVDQGIVELPAPEVTENDESDAVNIASGVPMSLSLRFMLAEWTK